MDKTVCCVARSHACSKKGFAMQGTFNRAIGCLIWNRFLASGILFKHESL